jgi:Bacterial Ig-like domain
MAMRNYGLILIAVLGVGIGCGSKAAKGELTVSGSPTGEVDGQLRVVLAFSRPMVAKPAVGQTVAMAPLTITPDLPREARWSDDKTLVVTPTGKLPVSTKYTVTIPGSAKALDGAVLGQPTTFEFFTERLTGTIEVVGAAERATKDPILKLTFNQDVAFDQIASACSVAGPARRGSSSARTARLAPQRATPCSPRPTSRSTLTGQ